MAGATNDDGDGDGDGDLEKKYMQLILTGRESSGDADEKSAVPLS